jgi:hypothetical protein
LAILAAETSRQSEPMANTSASPEGDLNTIFTEAWKVHSTMTRLHVAFAMHSDGRSSRRTTGDTFNGP